MSPLERTPCGHLRCISAIRFGRVLRCASAFLSAVFLCGCALFALCTVAVRVWMSRVTTRLSHAVCCVCCALFSVPCFCCRLIGAVDPTPLAFFYFYPFRSDEEEGTLPEQIPDRSRVARDLSLRDAIAIARKVSRDSYRKHRRSGAATSRLTENLQGVGKTTAWG